MRIACIYWKTSSVGGIATHLNSLRTAAIKAGDTFDILHSTDWKTKQPSLFSERQWIRGGDTNIWVDGEIPQTPAAARWLEENYDAVYFGCICPHPTKAYPEPQFQVLYDVSLPKVAGITDGYWDEYSEWGRWCLRHVKALTVVQPSYALPLRKEGFKNIHILRAPFIPKLGSREGKSDRPLLVWPNQWKNIKGITQFLECIPSLPPEVEVQLYSNGIRYYQLRTEEVWKNAVSIDKFQGYNGNGRATFFGNVQREVILNALERAWYTVNLQGMKSKKEAYQQGSYNYTEVEALWYGAVPILHSSTQKTDLPTETYLCVDSADEIPDTIKVFGKDFVLNEKRMETVRDFIRDNHFAGKHYGTLRNLF